ncbi:MAG: DUF1616 domain-containing protein [Theionarchaea archaeon]|nr:DUF1616 domain-containing protein [Theionarchaea archaeon]MBU6999785.1 DUF1616 domain-containing protein [Theionarchaea archaeon]MBU7033676.1 DUF1616 domain-containing protein [Theionarchaea archaeon]MBU7040491.1 DUF1616 domain-containing protein [Theionarchaea archaeon]
MVKSRDILMVSILASISIMWIVAPVYGRAVTGFLFVLFLPGFSLVYALFPHRELDSIETAALSFGLSICVVVLGGVILDILWEISLIPVVYSLSLLSVTCLLFGATRRLYIRKSRER